MIQVVRVDADSGSCLGVLQPVTSLVSTLSLLQPQHQRQLLKKLVNPPVDSGSCCGPCKTVSLPLISKGQPSNKRGKRRSRKASGVVQVQAQDGVEKKESNVHGTLLRSLPGSSQLVGGISDSNGYREMAATSMERNSLEKEEDGFVTRCASDCKLYASLQLLFRKSNKGMYMHRR